MRGSSLVGFSIQQRMVVFWERLHGQGLLLLLGALFFALLFSASEAKPKPEAPYPPSKVISGVMFDWSTHRRLAPGSDNWAVTWAADDHQYTTWGDGGGFGGTNDSGRVSLGFARIEGGPDDYQGVNVWGGVDAARPARFTGKSYGILSIGGVLYAWRCGDGSRETAYKFQELYRSDDYAGTWTPTGVRFDPDSFPASDRGFFCPTFLQFGKDYAGSRDEYVYIYAPEVKRGEWEVQGPGEITLVRAPVDGLADPARYEFYAGMDASGSPRWTAGAAGRQPVFSDPQNGVMRLSASYNPGLGRYFLVVEHTARSKGNIGIYDGPTPWGPWTTVLFEQRFGTGQIEPSTFFWNFSNKWLSADGLRFVLVFTGTGENDAWNTVAGSFTLAGSAPAGGMDSGDTCIYRLETAQGGKGICLSSLE